MTLVTLRAGVSFQADAAASFARMEADCGRRLDTNRTTSSWDEQMSLYVAYWNYRKGIGPWAPLALHPSATLHVYRPGDPRSATAWDTDERGDWMNAYGWIADVPGEPWHREYRAWRDTHRDRPAGGGAVPLPTPTPTRTRTEEELSMFQIVVNQKGGGTKSFLVLPDPRAAADARRKPFTALVQERFAEGVPTHYATADWAYKAAEMRIDGLNQN